MQRRRRGRLAAGRRQRRVRVGYYTRKDLDVFGRAAPAWTTCDQYFSAIMAPTFPNRLLFDHTSVLRMIEWRWGLDPLTVRDATANDLAEALDFTAPDLGAPRSPVPAGPSGAVCVPPTARAAMSDDLRELRALTDAFGWPP